MRRPKTISAYQRAYSRYEEWAIRYPELNIFPANELSIGTYVMVLVQGKKSNSTIRQFLASVSWMHELAGYPDPTNKHTVKSIVQSACRQSAKPVVHKEPVPKQILQDIHDSVFKEQSDKTLPNVRDFAMLLISFVGFLRYEETANIRRNHLHLFYDHLSLDIPRSKTDASCRGQHLKIIGTSADLCCLTWLTRYLMLSGIPDGSQELIFRSVFYDKKTKKWALRKTDKILSHTTVSEMFQNRLMQSGNGGKEYTLHGLRAGGVSLAANEGVAESQYKTHGRWASNAVGAYVQQDLNSQLAVSTAMKM